MKSLFVLAIFLLASTANAGDCRQAVVVEKVVQHYSHVAPTAYVQPVLLFVQQPSYTVGLSVHDKTAELDLRELRLELREMKLMLEQRGAMAMPLTMPATKAVNCQSCHDGSKDAPKMDFSMLTPAQKALSAERVLDGTMPPKSRLSKEEKRQVLAEVVK